ncbi:MAG: hypothetical protein OER91_03690 [Gammaproteobacteria bacterium]|nr:hypothetical protein [Gammaproteobacteria bacterium]
MTVRAFFVVFWACLIATAAVAGEERRTEIKIAVEGEDAVHRVFHFDSQDSDVDLHDMEVGESQVITDSDGNEVTVQRTEDGFEFDVEGEKIEIAGLHGDHELTMLHDAHDVEDVIIEKHKQVRVIKSHDTNGVTIISGDEIDAETRAALEKVLKEGGKDGEVVFIDGSELTGGEQVHGARREVRIIKEKKDATN